jgi:uncharacterized membrane protein
VKLSQILSAVLSPRRIPTSLPRTVARVALGGVLAFAGTTHLTVARDEFRAQVPEWVPLSEDTVVLASGVVEIGLGAALIALPRRRVAVGLLVAAFFVAIFPGNISQLATRTDAFGLDTDLKRGIRLPFQVLLVLWSLWSTGAVKDLRHPRG